jgi:hypothetical protein
MEYTPENEGAMEDAEFLTNALEATMVGAVLLGPFMIGPLYMLIGMVNHL